MSARRTRARRGKGLRVAVLHNHEANDIVVALAANDIVAALDEGGHRGTLVAVEADEGARSLVEAIDGIASSRTDVVFNLCEAVAGKSAHAPLVPHLLELAGLTYTGSGPLGLGLAQRKDRARLVLTGAGVPIPSGTQYEVVPRRAPPLVFPLFCKLAGEDAAVGIDAGSVVHDFHALARRVDALLSRHAGPVLVEEFIPGREIYVSLVGPGPKALPPHETDFSDMPAGAKKLGRLGPELAMIARRAFISLGLRDYARVDFRVDVAGRPYVIDVNPNCDLSTGAGMARAASFGGWSHADLIDRIVRSAMLRATRSRRGARRPR